MLGQTGISGVAIPYIYSYAARGAASLSACSIGGNLGLTITLYIMKKKLLIGALAVLAMLLPAKMKAQLLTTSKGTTL